MNNEDVWDGPNSKLFHHLSLLVALRAEEGIILTQSLLAGVETEKRLSSVLFVDFNFSVSYLKHSCSETLEFSSGASRTCLQL